MSRTTAEVVPGAEPFSAEGGPIGILMCHGFTGNPASVRPIGEVLAARGFSVEAPRYPGHGTHWRDLANYGWEDWAAEVERALDRLTARCDAVLAFGLSMGGAMAFHMAATRPDAIRAVVAVNTYLLDRRIVLTPYLWRFLPSQKGVGNDVAKEGVDEIAYERIPARSIAQLARFVARVRSELPRVRQPVLIFHSKQDHVVPKGTLEWILDRVGSEETEVVDLPRSYHVATLDHDADLIAERTAAFAEQIAARR